MADNRGLQEAVVSTYIYEYPAIKIHEFPHKFANGDQYQSHASITIGDLHGNPIKLLHILLSHGVIDFEGTQNEKELKFKELVELYDDQIENGRVKKKVVLNFYENNICRFKEILAGMKFNESPPLIRLLGDTLSDRGKNDIYMLFLFSMMDQNKIKTEILLSNHDLGFITSFTEHIIKKEYINNRRTKFDIEPATSLENFYNFMENIADALPTDKLDEFHHSIVNTVNKSYFSHLKLLSCEYNQQKERIDFFTHAPVGIETINLIANYMDIKFSKDSLTGIFNNINKMNAEFNAMLSNGDLKSVMKTIDRRDRKKYKRLFEENSMDAILNHISSLEIEKDSDEIRNIQRYCLYRLIWERVEDKKDESYDLSDMKTSINNKIKAFYHHGHDSPDRNEHLHAVKTYDNERGKMHDVEDEPRPDKNTTDYDEWVGWQEDNLVASVSEIDKHFHEFKRLLTENKNSQFFTISNDEDLIRRLDELVTIIDKKLSQMPMVIREELEQQMTEMYVKYHAKRDMIDTKNKNTQDSDLSNKNNM